MLEALSIKYRYGDGSAMMRNRFHLLLMPVLALCMCGLPAMAGTLFSDMGPSGSVYDCCDGWTVSGSENIVGTSYTSANLFTVAGSGSLAVSQIDLAVGNAGGVNTFYATIWTDNAGAPGSQVAGAYWNPLSTTTSFGSCCGLVSVTGITGVDLTGGQQYFMILGPLSTSDNSWNAWNENNQGINGDVQNSTNGGATWNEEGSNTTGAFDILSATPESGSLLLLGTGLIGMLGAFRRRARR
jgi:hypothetical protein